MCWSLVVPQTGADLQFPLKWQGVILPSRLHYQSVNRMLAYRRVTPRVKLLGVRIYTPGWRKVLGQVSWPGTEHDDSGQSSYPERSIQCLAQQPVLFTNKLIILLDLFLGGDNRKERMFGIYITLLSIKVSVLLTTSSLMLLLQSSSEPKQWYWSLHLSFLSILMTQSLQFKYFIFHVLSSIFWSFAL